MAENSANIGNDGQPGPHPQRDSERANASSHGGDVRRARATGGPWHAVADLPALRESLGRALARPRLRARHRQASARHPPLPLPRLLAPLHGREPRVGREAAHSEIAREGLLALRTGLGVAVTAALVAARRQRHEELTPADAAGGGGAVESAQRVHLGGRGQARDLGVESHQGRERIRRAASRRLAHAPTHHHPFGPATYEHF